MLKEFRDFAVKGSVLDMAIGIVIGGAFSPIVKSLVDDLLMPVIGLFMGVLGGLFVLGVMTRKANGKGALTGALGGAAFMFFLWKFTRVNGYIYTFSGITVCFVVGYLASLVLPGGGGDIEGLTVYTMRRKEG